MKIGRVENKSGWLVGGGVVASLLASVCCIGPLILTFLGVSGAAVLSKFEFLRVPMTLLVFALFVVAGLGLFRNRNSCEPGSICADPKKFKRMLVAYWMGLLIAALGITSPWWVAWLFS